MILLHGDDTFQQNWLFWSDIRLFSPENKGSQILEKDIYLRLLLAMVLAGVATAIKRTVLALYFGKKTTLYYKPRMDKLLGDMMIISDVAQLGSEAEDLVAAASENDQSIGAAVTKTIGAGGNFATRAQWQNITDLENSSEGGSHTESLEGPVLEQPSGSFEAVDNESLTDSEEANDDDDDEIQSSSDSSSDGDSSKSDAAAAIGQKKTEQKFSSRESLSRSEKKFKDLLDRWDEPENKSTKVSRAAWFKSGTDAHTTQSEPRQSNLPVLTFPLIPNMMCFIVDRCIHFGYP